jgi:hypothetical protein
MYGRLDRSKPSAASACSINTLFSSSAARRFSRLLSPDQRMISSSEIASGITASVNRVARRHWRGRPTGRRGVAGVSADA